MSSVRGLAATSVFAVVMSVVPAVAPAQTVNAAWDLSAASDEVTSYDVCVGTTSLVCNDVRWSAPPTQNWFSFTASRGVLHLVTVRAVSRNGAGPYAPELRVSTPRLSPISDRSAVVGATSAIDLVVTDPDNSGVSFTAAFLPPGITIDTRSGRLIGRPTTIGTYRPTITVSDAFGADTQSFAWTIVSGGTNPVGATSPMTGVTLSFTPASPRPPGSTVVLAAQGAGGSGPAMYRFWVQPWGGQWQIVQDWSASAVYSWRPSVAGGYNLSVSGRTGTTGEGVGDSRTFEVTAGAGGTTGTGGTGGGTGGGATRPMTGVTFSLAPSPSPPVGTPVVISAQGQGGSGPAMYRFWIQPWGGQWQLVQDWNANSRYTWTPRLAGGYNVSVYARTGSSGDGVGTSQNVDVRR